MPDINLLPETERSQERIDDVRKKLSIVSIGLLAITALFTFVTLIFFQMQASKKNNLVSQIQDNSSQINSLKATEELIVVIKGKTTAAENVLKVRQDVPVFFGKLAELVPEGVSFSDMRFTGEKVVISGKARSSAEIAGLVSSLSSSQGSHIISNVSIDSLSSTENGNYSFVLSAQLVQEAKAKEQQLPLLPQ